MSLAAASAGFILTLAVVSADEFRVTSIQLTNNNVRIAWNALGGSNYVVQSVTASPGGGFNTNFVDLSPVIFVPNPGLQSTSYTHVGGMLNSTSRFYRVRSFPAPPVLQIQPTNVVIGLGMTNRYRVLVISPDNTTQDVTGAATFTSLNNTIAQVAGVVSGFALVRGNSAGNASLRAVYQGITNTVNLTVAQLTGMYTVPPLSQISDYVEGNSTLVKVVGIFSNGQTNNITPASNLGGGAAVTTRVDYNVRADVANSFALITGQSAANGDIAFAAGGLQTDPILVTWCKYTSVTLQPQSAQIGVGDTQPFAVTGHQANGVIVNVFNFDINDFTSSDENIAHADAGTLRVSGRSSGDVTIRVEVNNGAGCSALSDSASVTVIAPPIPVGIYTGTFAGQVDNGGFGVMLRSNGLAYVAGYNTPQDEGVFASAFPVATDGTFATTTLQGGKVGGTFTTNAVSGNFTNSTGQIGAYSGNRKADSGTHAADVGYYSGTYSGAFSGSAYVIVAADGTVFFFTTGATGDGGGFGVVNAAQSFSATTVPDSLTVSGALDPTTHVISGTYGVGGTTLGTFSVTRTLTL